MATVLVVILMALVFAYFFAEILRYFSVPRVVGHIIAGIALGIPIVRNLILTKESIGVLSFLSNIGIILMFFFIGLEINLTKSRKNFRESSFVSISNTIIPLVLGFFAGKFIFGFETGASLIIGISLAVSSQAISLDILEELNLLKSRIGNLIISIGAVDDVFELFLVSIILIMFSSVTGIQSIQKFILDMVGFFLLVVLFRVTLIPLAIQIFERDKSQANLFMGSLIIVLVMASIAELFGVGSLIGALIAGVLVRQTLLTGADHKPWRKNELSHSIHIISFGFLIPIFFVNVGLSMKPELLSSNLFLILTMLIIGLFGIIGGTVIGVMLSKGSFSEGLTIGWGLAPKGDVEIVIATLALGTGIINQVIFTAIISVSIICTLIAPIVFKRMIKRHSELVTDG
ncbi:MAG TPA: cation:proton antiporter [Candidatus Nanoarchaeia archaeon]|nr:cation:proton antiporter [Candidatus Nanoarchaeia archaeon]